VIRPLQRDGATVAGDAHGDGLLMRVCLHDRDFRRAGRRPDSN
jgi:hypothetical protein